MDQLYEFTGPLRSMIIEKAPFRRLGPFWKENTPLFFEKREYDSHGRLLVREKPDYTEYYAYMAGERELDFRRSALYRFNGEKQLESREIWHYGQEGTLRGKEIYRGEAAPLFVEIQEDPARGVLVEKDGIRIRGKQFDSRGRLISEYLYGGDQADLIIKYTYTDEGFILKKEEADKNGSPIKTSFYGCTESGLIREIRETDRTGELLYHRLYEYPRGEDSNWLVREEYALNGHGRKKPLSLTYRSLNFFHEPRLVREEPPQPVREKGKAEPTEDTKVFSNGFYRGQLKEGLPSGKGTFSYNDGSRYRGTFFSGKPEGRGELIRKDGSVYRGDFKSGIMHGRGIMEWSDGSRYEGPFRRGKMDGVGVYTWPNGDRFKGLFEKGKRTDQGLVERNE